MTKAAQHFDKRLDNFWSNKETQEYARELSVQVSNTLNSREFSQKTRDRLRYYTQHREAGTQHIHIYGVDVDAYKEVLTDATRGRTGGTWAHPKLAVFFARWLDVRFAVWCDAMIEDILKGKAEVVSARSPHTATPKRTAHSQ